MRRARFWRAQLNIGDVRVYEINSTGALPSFAVFALMAKACKIDISAFIELNSTNWNQN